MIGNLSFKTKYSQLGGSFFLLGVFIVASLSLASAKPLPPDHLSLEVVAAGNLFEWQNAGNDGRNPPDTSHIYHLYRSSHRQCPNQQNFLRRTKPWILEKCLKSTVSMFLVSKF